MGKKLELFGCLIDFACLITGFSNPCNYLDVGDMLSSGGGTKPRKDEVTSPQTPSVPGIDSVARKSTVSPVQTVNQEGVSQLYNKFFDEATNLYKKYNQDTSGSYKPGYEEPEHQGMMMRFVFPDEHNAMGFLKYFASNTKDKNFLVRNDTGEIIGKVNNGKLSIFDGEKGFKEADEHSVLPKSGLSEQAFKELHKKSHTSALLYPNMDRGNPAHQTQMKASLAEKQPLGLAHKTEDRTDDSQTVAPATIKKI